MSSEKLGTEIRQKQIAQAALTLISSQGLKRLSLASVGRRVGIVPSAIYRHFKNKDQLVHSLLDQIQDMLHKNVEEVREETSDPLERIKRLLFRHIAVIRDNQGIPRIIFSEIVFSGPPQRRAKVYALIRKYLEKVEEFVRQGQRKGQIRRELDPKAISIMFLGLIQPAAILWHMSDGEFDVTKHTEKAWKIFSQAIRKA